MFVGVRSKFLIASIGAFYLISCSGPMKDERVLSVVRGCDGKEYCYIEESGKSMSLISVKIDPIWICKDTGTLEIEKKESNAEDYFYYLTCKNDKKVISKITIWQHRDILDVSIENCLGKNICEWPMPI